MAPSDDFLAPAAIEVLQVAPAINVAALPPD
jgi:hypothetical protein